MELHAQRAHVTSSTVELLTTAEEKTCQLFCSRRHIFGLPTVSQLGSSTLVLRRYLTINQSINQSINQ